MRIAIDNGCKADTFLTVFRTSKKLLNYTPEIVQDTQVVQLEKGSNTITVEFGYVPQQDQYVFICILKNELVSVKTSNMFLTGTMMVMNRYNKAVATSGVQSPPDDIGIDEFEFWVPSRRPANQNIALILNPAIEPYGVSNLTNGFYRPTNHKICI